MGGYLPSGIGRQDQDNNARKLGAVCREIHEFKQRDDSGEVYTQDRDDPTEQVNTSQELL